MRPGLQGRGHVTDTWSGLSHIAALASGQDGTGVPAGMATWLDDTDKRRLTAYLVLDAYQRNLRRYWLPDGMWQAPVEIVDGKPVQASGKSEGERWREYGHAALVVSTARGLVLGEDQTVVIPDLVDTADDDPALARERAVRDYLDGWADAERLQARMIEGETNAIGLGDGVYVLAWSPEKQRPILRVYDPGMYFPDLLAIDTTPGWVEEFPPTVHLAWEYEGRDGARWLRRHTWRMVQLDTPQNLPWGDSSSWTCMYEAAEWRLDRLRGDISVYTLDPAKAGGRYVGMDGPEDLLVDFIPVVHVPNTVAGIEHFGESTLTAVAQIVDDLEGSDTDNAETAQAAAAAVAVLSGGGGGDLGGVGGAARQWNLSEGQSAAWADSSRVLVAGTSRQESLLAHLSVNSRLGAPLLGRISPADVNSGYLMSLGFASARALLREARLVRHEKYALLLKFVQRLTQARDPQILPAGATVAAHIEFGAGLPTDRAAAVTEVRSLLTAPAAISVATAVRMLQAAGIPIDDAEAEVDAIREDDLAGAVALVDATGDVAAARARLGLDPSDTPPDPTPPADPAPPQPTPPAPTEE